MAILLPLLIMNIYRRCQAQGWALQVCSLFSSPRPPSIHSGTRSLLSPSPTGEPHGFHVVHAAPHPSVTALSVNDANPREVIMALDWASSRTVGNVPTAYSF